MRKTILPYNLIRNNTLLRRAMLAISFGLLPSQVLAAVDCQTLPSCEALGYTYSASDCNGMSIVKCPFDQSKLFCNKGTTTATPSDPVDPDPVPEAFKDAFAGCAPDLFYDPVNEQCVTSPTDFLVLKVSDEGIRTAYLGKSLVSPRDLALSSVKNWGSESCASISTDDSATAVSLLTYKEAEQLYYSGHQNRTFRLNTNIANYDNPEALWAVSDGVNYIDTTITGGVSGGNYPNLTSKRYYSAFCGVEFGTYTESESVGASTVFNCVAGQYFDPTKLTCSSTKTDYLVLSADSTKVRTAYVAKHSAFYTRTAGSVSQAQTYGYDSCENNDFDRDLLTVAELETLWKADMVNHAIQPAAANNNADIMWVAKDKNGCIDGSIIGAPDYYCGKTHYSVICPKTFTASYTVTKPTCSVGQYTDAKGTKCSSTENLGYLVLGVSANKYTVVSTAKGNGGLANCLYPDERQGEIIMTCPSKDRAFGYPANAPTSGATADCLNMTGGEPLNFTQMNLLLTKVGADVFATKAEAQTNNVIVGNAQCYDTSLIGVSDQSVHTCSSGTPFLFMCTESITR